MTNIVDDNQNMAALADLYDTYRLMKNTGDKRIEVICLHARAIGQFYADKGGAQALKAFLDKFAEANGEDMEEWLWRRWDGLRLPGGAVWIS